MTYQNEYTLSIDIKRASKNQTPIFVGNDTAILYIQVLDNGEEFDISQADRLTMSFKRPDGQNVTGQGVFENGYFKYELGTTEMSHHGMMEAIAQFYIGTTRISTRPFHIKIIGDIEDGIGSETQLTLLQELFVEVDTVTQDALAAGNYARERAESFTHKGDYSPATIYKNGNVVAYGGINYFCIQDTTVGIDPLNGAYWTVVSPQASINDQTWTATEGQTVFTITNGNYVPNQGNIEVWVGGVGQVSGQGYTETNSTTITLAEGVPAGTVIFAKWFEGHMSISKSHKNSHEVGGQDELDITKLKNFQEQVVSPLAETASKTELTNAVSPKADKSYVDTNVAFLDTKINSQASGSPKGTFSTLASLQTAYPTGNSNVYVVTADGNWYYWNSSAWVAGGVYQATAVAKGSLSGDKLDANLASIMELVPKNLFTGATVSGSVNSDTGNVDYPTDTTRKATDFIPITPTRTIFTNWLELVQPNTLTIQKLTFYDANKTFIISVASTTNEIQPPSNAAYARQNVASGSGTVFSVDLTQYKIYQTWESSIQSKFEKNDQRIVGYNDILDISYANMFVGTTAVGSIDSNTGALVETTDTARLATDYIPINPSLKIYTNWLDIIQPNTIIEQAIAFYSSSKTFISATKTTSDSVTPPSNAAYVRQNLKTSGFAVSLSDYKIWQEDSSAVYSQKITEVEKNIQDILDKYGISQFNSDVFYAYDFIEVGLTDSQVIQRCLDFSSLKSQRVIVFDRKSWFIDEAVLLPANTTVIVNDCLIKQNNEVFDNVFRGDNLVINTANPNHFPTSIAPISNIKILGIGNAKIEGCDVNKQGTHPTQGTQTMVGDYWGWRTLQISLSKCTGFEIAGISFTKTRCWAISLDKCSDGEIHDLDITSDVKNGDGIDLRSGCHDINIYNISGSTSDDTVAMTAIKSSVADPYVYPMEPSAFEDGNYTKAELGIHDVSIQNVTTVGQHHGVICLSNDGRQVYNISINGIKEPVASSRESVVKIYSGYGTGYVANDIHSIRVNDVVSKGAAYAIQVEADVDDVWFNKIKQEKPGGVLSTISDTAGVTVTAS